jgi:hypothetical protein
MKVLILGGYGVFGGRLAQLLRDEAGVELLIAGRDLDRARRFCEAQAGAARMRPLRVDRGSVEAVLAAERPDVLVDASGPFQAYGADPYRVLRAALAAGVNYLDFSDGADFVAGVGQFDEAARAAGVWALSGVSSFPVLTAAVLREIGRTMTIRRVTAGIAPSPYAGVGLNVLRAVLGYAGAPVAVWRGGRKVEAVGLGESLRRTVAPPGALPLTNLRYSLVEVPDLLLIPATLPGIEEVWVGAAPQPEILQRVLNVLARLRHRWRLPSLAPLARPAQWALKLTEAGEHRGGMFVEAEGERDGQPARRAWHMLAEGDDGPLIPSMAIEAILRKALTGGTPAPGARAATEALDFADYARLFARRRIRWGWREERAGSLYERVLGEAYEALPSQVRALHRPGAASRWAGRAEVERGRGPVAALVSRLFGFPAEGADVPVEVRFRVDAEGRETWERRFAGRVMRSVQEEGTGRNAHLVVERFGPLAFGMALVRDGGRLLILPRRWSFWGLPLPRGLMPQGEGWEEERDGRFRFHVEIALPLLGRVVRYRGWLEPAA